MKHFSMSRFSVFGSTVEQFTARSSRIAERPCFFLQDTDGNTVGVSVETWCPCYVLIMRCRATFCVPHREVPGCANLAVDVGHLSRAMAACFWLVILYSIRDDTIAEALINHCRSLVCV